MAYYREDRLILSRPVDSNAVAAWIYPNIKIPSVTVRSLGHFLSECKQQESSTKFMCRTAYRGQTREYRFRNDTISLLAGRERESTFGAYKFGSLYGEPVLNKEFCGKFFNKISAITRREGGIKYKKKRSKSPQIYFELLLLQGILQHYGIRTVCIDLTADPIVALWFAFHKQIRIMPSFTQARLITYKPTDEPYGVVYAMEVPAPYIGRDRNIVSNVLTADLSVEIPDKNWRPYRQSALTISQQEWGSLPGELWNRLAGCIRKRIVVSRELFNQIPDKERRLFRLCWLFPPCSEDPIYKWLSTRPILRYAPVHIPEWIIYNDYIPSVESCTNFQSIKKCFMKQNCSDENTD